MKFSYKKLAKKSLFIAGGTICIGLVSMAIAFVLSPTPEPPYQPQFYTTAPTPPVRQTPKPPPTVYFEKPPDILPAVTLPPKDEGGIIRPPARTNFLFIGLDSNNLADAIMVGTFYRETGEIRLMSVPRDMYTRLSESRLAAMRADNLNPPEVLKINAVRAYGGRKHGVKHLQAQLSEMLGVDFHHYIEVELDAFRRIVDAIGGVTMHIPRHLYYSDPEQGLVIDIPAGLHHLCGAMAEKVVRYRSYPMGDLARNNVQMDFMAALIQQALTRDAILNDPLALASAILGEVRTSASVLEVAKYLPYIGRVSSDRIETFAIPGAGKYIDGISWFVPDADALPAVINQVFYVE